MIFTDVVTKWPGSHNDSFIMNSSSICSQFDYSMIFTDVVTKWPGSHHDSFIMNSSSICSQFELGKYGTGWLLGDSGYALKAVADHSCK